MPLPTPDKGEAKNHFISRCMHSSVIQGEYDSQKQQLAVCHSQWKRKGSVQHFFLTAELQQMAKSEIAEMIDPDLMKRIKQTDAHPQINVYSIGHQGEAKATDIKFGRRAIQYAKDTVRKLFEKIVMGTPVFDGHVQGTNRHEGRTLLGNIIGKRLMDIGGILHSIIATYIRPEYRERHLDVASIEANVVYSDAGETPWIEKFTDVTGIALGSSATNTPALPGCTLLGSMQAFQEFTLTQVQQGELTMDLKELKVAVAEGGWSPSDVFNSKTLLLDETVVKHVRAEKQTEFEHAKRVEGQLGKARESLDAGAADHEKVVESLKSQNVMLLKELTGLKSGEIVKGAMGKMELTDRQKEFVLGDVGAFKTDETDTDGVETAAKGFIKESLVRYDRMNKFFTGKETDQASANVAAGDKGGEGDPDDMMNPKQNPFIPSAQGGDE